MDAQSIPESQSCDMSPRRRPRAFLRRLAKPALAAGATLLALLASEALVRAFRLAPAVKIMRLDSYDCVYTRSTNPMLGFELKAGYRNPDADLIQTYERTNAYGQRDRERTQEKPPGVRRVIVLGDSVVEGYGIREESTITRRLEELYTDGKTEVLNFGVSAYCTRAEVELLEVKGLQFDPDVVVVVFVENDFDNFNREAFPLGGTVDRPALVEGLFEWSHLFRLICLQWNLFDFTAEREPVRWNQGAIGDNNVPEGLQRLRQLADRHGFEPVVVVWPRFLDDRITDVPFMPGSAGELVIERLAAMHGIPSARLSPFFERHRSAAATPPNPRLRYTSGDELHPSEEGCRIAAGALKRILDDLEAGRLRARTEKPTVDPAAIDAARSLGANRPGYVRVYNRIGTELLRAGKPAEAVEQLKLAIEADPRHAGAHYNLGVAYEELGRRPEARAQYEEAVRLQPDLAMAQYGLARLLLAQRDVDAAMARLERTIEIDPRHVSALNALGMELGKRGNYAEARAYLERAVRADPDHTEARNNLGVIHIAEGRLQQALAEFREALRADPDNRKALENLRRTESMLRSR